MSVKAGDIVIELNLDNDGFTARVKDSGQVLRQLQGDFGKTATSVKKLEDAHESLSTKFRHAVMTMGNLRFVAMDLHDVFLKLPAEILKTAGQMERLEITMTGLSNKFTEAQKKMEGAANFKFITDMAKKAPFEVGAIADAFIKFKTGGIDPTTGALDALIQSVSKFGGNSETLKRASIAIQQMMGKGVVSMEELRQQLGEAIPTAMQDMADGMGLSMTELAKAVKSGTVAADTAVEKMLLRMKINNLGASERMMESWVGALAQLKTEWALTAKFISEQSGFGDAAKGALSAIGQALSSDDLKRFALQFGGTLKDATTAFVDFSKVVVENRDTIKTLIEVWLLYKAGTSVIFPVLKSIESGFISKSAAVRGSIAAVQESVAAERAAAVQEAVIGAQRAENAAARLAKYVADRQAELASVRARNAAILEQDRIMAAEQEALSRRAYIPGLNDGAQREVAAARLAELSRKNSELIAKERELATAVATGTAAMNAANVVAAQKVATLNSVASAAGTSARAATALGVAMEGLKVAFNAVGGWIGILTMALVAGIEIWNRYGRASEEAAARALRAKQGLSSEEDYVKAQQQKDAAKQALDAANRMLNVPLGMSGSDKNVAQKITEQRIEAVRKAQQDFDKAADALESVSKSRKATQARERNEEADKQTDQEVRGIELQAQQGINAAKEWAQAKVDVLDKNAKDYDKKVKEIAAQRVARENDVYLKSRQDQIGLLQREKADADRAAGDQSRSENERMAALERSKSLAQKLSAKEAELAGAQKAISDPNRTIASQNQTTKLTPIQKLLADLHAENAKLDSEIGNLGKKLTAWEIAQAKAAALQAKFERGEFKSGKGTNATNATQAQIDEAKMLTRKVELEKERVKDSQALTSQIEQIGPRYKEAMELLVDPLGLNKSGSETRKIEEFFTKFDARRLIAMANEAGFDSITALKQHMLGMASVIDVAPEFQKMVEATKEMNAAIVDDTRLAAKERQRAADETYRNFMDREIQKARAAGATEGQLAQMQRELDENTAARAATLAEKFQSPMEKMAKQWANYTRNMEESSANWADQTLNAIVSTAQGSKTAFADLVKSILADMLKIELKQRLAGSMSTLMNAALGALGVGGGGVNLSGNTGSAMDAMTLSANGNVVGPWGATQLKKYAAGGIANSPQLSIFGEGDTPEAYVPLPDGRRIPVAMQGGGQGAAAPVTINVINQTGQNVTAQQGKTRFDGKQTVLDVVLSAANQPGPFREGLKNAMNK
jgi:tape measure domain-containing protein